MKNNSVYLACSIALVITMASGGTHAADRYFLPAEGQGAGFCTQSSGNGTSYESPWRCTSQINWSDFAGGGTLYICDVHQRAIADSTLIVSTSGSLGAPITISGDCKDSSQNSHPGVLLGTGGKLEGTTGSGGWTVPEAGGGFPYGAYSRPYSGGTENQMLEAPADGVIGTYATNLTRLIEGVRQPSFVTLTATGNQTATLTITPGVSDTGTYPMVVQVSDGGLVDIEVINIYVTDGTAPDPGYNGTRTVIARPSGSGQNINYPPDLAAIGDITVAPGTTANIALSAADPNTTKLFFAAKGMPSTQWDCGIFSQNLLPHPSYDPQNPSSPLFQSMLYYKPSRSSGGTGSCDTLHTVYTNGPDATLKILNAEYVKVENLWVVNGNSGIWIDGGDHIDISNVNVRYGRDYGIRIQSFSATNKQSNNYGTISGSEIYESGNGIYFTAKRVKQDANGFVWTTYPNTYWTIKDNHIHDVAGHLDAHCLGMQGGSIHNTVEFNHMHHCTGSGITVYNEGFGDQIKHNTIRYNVIHDITKAGSIGANQYGIEFGNTNCPQHPDDTVGNIVAYNVLLNTDGHGVHTKSSKPTAAAESSFSWSFNNNVFYQVGKKAGAAAFFWTQAAAYGVANYGSTGEPNPCDPANIIPDVTKPGYWLHNNIFMDSPNFFILPQMLNHPLLTADFSGIITGNNLFYSSPGAGTPTGFVWQTQEDIQSNGACVNAGGTLYVNQYACEFNTLEGYRNFSGKESGSIMADPLLTNPASGDFHWAGTPSIIPGAGDFRLTTDSPAIDRGIPVLPSDTLDIAGTPVGASPDIGAYEYPGADLSVSVSDSPDPVNTDSLLSYTVTITNVGVSDATGVTVEHALPAGVAGNGVPSQGSCTGSSIISCNLGTLGNGQGATITVTATPGAEALFNSTPNNTFSINVSATTTVSATETDPVPVNNTATTTTNVRLACLGRAVTMRGTSGDDGTSNKRFAGGNGDDVIHTLSGADWIDGKGGNDTICGGAGNDNLIGSGGADALSGGSSTDTCNGGSGTDTTDGTCEAVNSIP